MSYPEYSKFSYVLKQVNFKLSQSKSRGVLFFHGASWHYCYQLKTISMRSCTLYDSTTCSFVACIYHETVCQKGWVSSIRCATASFSAVNDLAQSAVYLAVEVCASSSSIILQSVLTPHTNTIWKPINQQDTFAFTVTPYWLCLNSKPSDVSWKALRVLNVYINDDLQDHDQLGDSNCNSKSCFCSFEGITKVL